MPDCLAARTRQIQAIVDQGDVGQAQRLVQDAAQDRERLADAGAETRFDFFCLAALVATQGGLPSEVHHYLSLSQAELQNPGLNAARRDELLIQWRSARMWVAVASDSIEEHARVAMNGCTSFLREPARWSPLDRLKLAKEILVLFRRCGAGWLAAELSQHLCDAAVPYLRPMDMAAFESSMWLARAAALADLAPRSAPGLPRLPTAAPTMSDAQLHRRSEQCLSRLHTVSLRLAELGSAGGGGRSRPYFRVPLGIARLEWALGGDSGSMLDAAQASHDRAARQGDINELGIAAVRCAEVRLLVGDHEQPLQVLARPDVHGRFCTEISRPRVQANAHFRRGEFGAARARYAEYALAVARANRTLEQLMNFGMAGIVRVLTAQPGGSRKRTASRQAADLQVVTRSLQHAALAKAGTMTVSELARRQGLTPRRLQLAFKDSGLAKPSLVVNPGQA